MARGIHIPIIGDPASVLRAINKTIQAGEKLGNEYKKVGVKAEEAAQLQIKASVAKDARLRKEIAVYRTIADTAQKGSREQIAAANLAAQAQGRLARALTVSEHEQRKLSAAAGRTGRDFGSFSRGALAGSGAVRSLGRSLAFASGSFLGGAGITFAIKSFIAQASRLQEETEKTGVVFGRNAGDVQRWSRTLALSFGVSTGAALESAGQFGNMFNSLHIAEQDSAAMSKRLTELAADMASFNNTSPADTLAALQSGLAGQVRPLRQFGVFLSEDRIKQEALNSGIAKNAAHLTANQKVLAAYNIILKDTAIQQGDVQRNTESQSVAQSKLRAEYENSAAILGDSLLPSITDLTNRAAKYLGHLNQTGELQRKVNTAFDEGGKVARGLGEAFSEAKSVLAPINGLLGGTEQTAKLLGITFLLLKTRALAASLGLTAVGTSAVVAEGEMAAAGAGAGKLTAGLTGLTAAPWIITVAVALEDIKDPNSIKTRGSKLLDIIKGGGTVEQGLESLPTIGPVIAAIHNAAKAGPKRVKLPPGQSPIGENALGGGRAAAGNSAALDTPGRRLGLLARFKKADLALAKAERTKATSDDRAALVQEAAIVKDEIASRKKAFRDKAALERQLGGIENQIAAIDKAADDARRQRAEKRKQQAAQRRADFLQSLQLGLDRAGLTRGLGDDIKAAKAQVKGLKDLLANDRHSLDLQQQLVAAEGQLADLSRQQREQRAAARKQAREHAAQVRENRQFRVLGLGPGGSPLAPTKAALKKELGNVQDALRGTFLDTNATRSVLVKIRKLMSGQLGALSADVRSTVKQMLDDLKGQLGEFDGFNLTRAEKRRRSLDKSLSGPVGGGSGSRGGRRGGGRTVIVNQTVVAHKGESADALARRLNFRARQAFAH